MHITFFNPPCFHDTPLSLFHITYLSPPHPMLTRRDFPLRHSLYHIITITGFIFEVIIPINKAPHHPQCTPHFVLVPTIPTLLSPVQI